jgi:putative ABC transport system permease protein
MLRNYFKIAVRNLLRHRFFTAINLAGLVMGLTACLLIGVYFAHELSYDGFHTNGDRIARVVMQYKIGDGAELTAGVTGTKVAPEFKRQFAEVEAGVRMYATEKVVALNDKMFTEKQFYFADSNFFEVFSFQLLVGNPKTALQGPQNLVITQATAQRYFGQENPVGKTLKVGEEAYNITGVAANCPANSHIQFDFLAGFQNLRAAQQPEQWGSANWVTYLLLRDETSVATLQRKIRPFMDTQFPKDELNGGYWTYALEPFTRVHLHSPVQNAFVPNVDITYLYLLAAVAVVILLIACFTYLNLTTARAADRAKEVGVRKVVGAARPQLFWQFMAEAAVLTTLALGLSLGLAALALPQFNELTGQAIPPSNLWQTNNLLILFGLGLVIAGLAGSYPALVLSGFRPLTVLKGSFKTSGAGLGLRKSLIVLQFGISVFLVVATLVVQGQLGFIQNRKLGYDKEHVVVLQANRKIIEQMETFKAVFKASPEVRGVTDAYETPVNIDGGYELWAEGMPEGQSSSISGWPVGLDFAQTLGLELVAGRDFTQADFDQISGNDPEKYYFHYILNETAVRNLGWTPQEAIGRRLNVQGPGEVTAVVRDFHFASLHQAITPLVIFPGTYNPRILVKLSGQNLPQTLDYLAAEWKKLAPHRPFAYEFMDQEFDQLYAIEARLGRAFSLFAGLAILLACLGLFGLATFTIGQRAKEVSIRKILGARTLQVSLLLTRDFLGLVALAFALAAPLAYLAMDHWLTDFAYRIEVAWWMLALAGAAALAMALISVASQSLRAALANPVDSLRSE